MDASGAEPWPGRAATAGAGGRHGAEAGGGRRQRQPGGPEQQVLEVEEGGQQDSRGPGGAQLPGEGRAGEQGLRQTGQIGEQLKVGVHPDQSGQKGERAGDMRGEAGEKLLKGPEPQGQPEGAQQAQTGPVGGQRPGPAATSQKPIQLGSKGSVKEKPKRKFRSKSRNRSSVPQKMDRRAEKRMC